MATGDLFGGFIYAKTLEGFQAQLEAGNVSDTQIAIIEDQQLFWTHGQYYKFEQPDTDTELDFDLRYVYAYGIQRTVNTSSPTLTRIGNFTLHTTLPVQSGMVGGLLDDDGNFTEFDDQTDWTSYDRSGESGQVMVEIPEHYEYFYDNGRIQQAWVSLYNISGFTKVPKMYISAYEATVDRTNLKLCSIVNTDEQYMGGNGTDTYAADDFTFCGCPASSLTLTSARAYARNRGTDVGLNGYGWNCYTYEAHRVLYWLFTIEYATLNCQLDYNSELTDDGYHQGGLGSGVTNLDGTCWNSWNAYNSFIPCGHTDSLGNQTGTVDFDMPNGYAEAAGASLTVSVPRYRGIENPFGHIEKVCDGALVYGTDNQLYVTTDPSLFSSTSYDDYTYRDTFSTTTNAYIKEIMWGTYGDLLASESGGASATYFCDYSSTSASNSIRVLFYGGSANYGKQAGMAMYYSSYKPTSTSVSYIGTRLCFFPE